MVKGIAADIRALYTVDLKGNDKYNDKAIESTRKGHLDFLAEVIKGEVLRAVTLKR